MREGTIKPELLQGNALEVVKKLDDESIQCVVTSPPYWALRDYGNEGQFGCEPTVEEYADNLVKLFEEIKPKLKEDGTVWINIGDSYAGFSGNTGGATGSDKRGTRNASVIKKGANLKERDLIGVPWVAALALREAGWYLRCDIVWAKPNPIPESVKNRPTRSHEFIFLLSKNPQYYYDMDAIREPLKSKIGPAVNKKGERQIVGNPKGKNSRDVWWIAPKSIRNSHIAVFPPELPKKCILAGTKPGDIVLDPFSGSGTTCRVARELGRKGIGIELSEEYHKLAMKLTFGDNSSLEDFL
jgi:DNA modification methylase